MNTLQRIVFAAMDWLTDGALTERNELQIELNAEIDFGIELRKKIMVLERANRELENKNFELAKENLRLKDIIQVYGGRTEIDKFVSDKTKIADLNTRIAGLEKRLALLSPKKLPGVTGKDMGLC